MTTVRPARPGDEALVLRFVRELADYEREPDAVEATEADLAAALFGGKPAAEAVIAEIDGEPAGFALYFHNFSTWTGKRGLYLEDLYVTPAARGRGVGRALLAHLAPLGWQHVNLTGDYLWDAGGGFGPDGFRTLRGSRQSIADAA